MQPRPSVVVVTGDLADEGTPQQYQQVKRAFAGWPGPLLACPGNRDVRPAFAQCILAQPATEHPLNQAHDVAGLRFLLLDSSIPGSEPGQFHRHGELSPASLDWLERELASSPLATMVALHHHPCSVGNPRGDQAGLTNGQALEEVLGRHPQVVATLIGHVHQACATTFAGRPLLAPGGVVATAGLDCERGPEQNPEAPPTVAVHLYDERTSHLTTHWRLVPEAA